jgi:hypothetical protein
MSKHPRLNARILADLEGRAAVPGRQRLKGWLVTAGFLLALAAAVGAAILMGFEHVTPYDLLGHWLLGAPLPQ